MLKGDGDSKHPYLFPNLREKTIDVFIDTVYQIKEVPSSFHRLGSSTDCCDVSAHQIAGLGHVRLRLVTGPGILLPSTASNCVSPCVI